MSAHQSINANKPFVLGLTGSIGMGKSTTAQMFRDEGVPVFDADAEVHELYRFAAVPLVEAAFPGVTVGGMIDRQRLSVHVVGNDAAMKKLESIVHPLLRQREEAFLDQAQKTGAAIVVIDSPLLFEMGGESRVDAVIVVSAPEHIQRMRILARPGMSVEKYQALLARQMPDAEKRARADFVVDTSQGLDPVRARIRDILTAAATMPRRRA